MPMAEDHQVVVGVRPALFARQDVMHVQRIGAASAEKAAATALIARENARPDLRPRFHFESQVYVA